MTPRRGTLSVEEIAACAEVSPAHVVAWTQRHPRFVVEGDDLRIRTIGWARVLGSLNRFVREHPQAGLDASVSRGDDGRHDRAAA